MSWTGSGRTDRGTGDDLVLERRRARRFGVRPRSSRSRCSTPRPSARRSRPRHRSRCSSPPTSSPGWGKRRSRSAGAAHRRGEHVRRAPAARSFEELESATLSVLAPDLRDAFGVEQRRHRVPRRGVGCVPRARRAADGLAGRPIPPSADHRLGEPRVRRLPRVVRSGHQRVPAVLGAARCRRREVEHATGAGFDDRRRLPDQRARSHQRVAGDGWPSGRRAQPGRRRRHRGGRRVATTAGGGRSCCSASRSRWWRCSRSSCRSRRAGSSRSRTCSARSSRTSSRRRSRSRPRSRGSGRSARSRPSSSRSPPSASVCSPCPCSTNLFMEDHYGTDDLRPAACSAPSAAIGVLVVLPFVGTCYDGLYRRDPARALRFVGLMILPAALLTPVQFFMPNVIAVHDHGRPAADPAVVASRWCGRSCSRSCRTGCGAWDRRSVRSTSSSSARPAARCSPALLTDEFGPRTAVIVIVVPSTIIGGFLILRECPVHPQRPVAGRRRAAGGDGRAPPPARSPDADPRAPGRRHRLLLRPGAGALRRRLRGATRRGARVARHQRRGQVDDPARHRRARHAGARCRASQRPHHHLHDARAAGEARYPDPARRQGRVPGDDGAREPGDGGVRVPRRRRRLPASRSTRAYDLFPALRERRRARGVAALRVVSSRCSRWR